MNRGPCCIIFTVAFILALSEAHFRILLSAVDPDQARGESSQHRFVQDAFQCLWRSPLQAQAYEVWKV